MEDVLGQTAPPVVRAAMAVFVRLLRGCRDPPICRFRANRYPRATLAILASLPTAVVCDLLGALPCCSHRDTPAVVKRPGAGLVDFGRRSAHSGSGFYSYRVTPIPLAAQRAATSECTASRVGLVSYRKVGG